MPALWASHHASRMTLGAQAQRRQVPRDPLRVPRRAHLGVEAVGFAKLTIGGLELDDGLGSSEVIDTLTTAFVSGLSSQR